MKRKNVQLVSPSEKPKTEYRRQFIRRGKENKKIAQAQAQESSKRRAHACN